MKWVGLRIMITVLLVGLVSVAIACGSDDDAAPAPVVTAVAQVDTAALAQAVQDAVLKASPKGVSADEINTMVKAAVQAAAPDTATPAEIQKMVEEAVAAAAQPGATKEEIEGLVSKAVSQSVATIKPGVSASEVQTLVANALKAVPTPATVEIVKEVDPRFAGTLRTTMIQINSLDPLSTSGLAASGVARHSQEAPFALDTVGQPHPVFTSKWTLSSDGLIYRFTLRDGIKWHDGQALKASDIVDSYRRGMGGNGGGGIGSNTGLIGTLSDGFMEDADGDGTGDFDKGWLAVDDGTWEIKLTKPANFVVEAMANIYSVMNHIQPPQQSKLTNEEVDNTLIGTGPFQLQEWIPGDRVIMTRYEDYSSPSGNPSGFAGRRVPFADVVEWIVIPDTAAQVAAMKTGQLHLLTSPFGGDVADQMKDDENIEIHPVTYPPPRMSIWPNHTEGPFSNSQIRQAVRLALPSERILTAAYGSNKYWRTCASMWTCTSYWENPDLDTEGYNAQDIATAKQMVTDAGYAGATMKMPVRILPLITDPSRIVRETLEAIGFVVEWTDMETGAFIDHIVNTRDWDMIVTSTTGFKDPFLGNTVHYKAKGWIHQYQDETNEMTDLIDRLYSESLTRAEQKELTDQMQVVFMRDLPLIQIGEGMKLLAVRKEVKGFVANEAVPMWNLWLEED
jgi:peptide/nickel transport system substrate-binding protein